MFYANDEPEGTFFYTDNQVVLSCIVLYCNKEHTHTAEKDIEMNKRGCMGLKKVKFQSLVLKAGTEDP